MSYDNKKKIPLDEKRINIMEKLEIEYWCEILHVTKEELIDAVATVGTASDTVKQYFDKEPKRAGL
ncbi:DUF3606 domain-containing protein [Ferruginibacter albus]|uniref:DUF3606 domain-containing protein n=1 Tax=Ferruginibacter albus TaxID=2875540 RepID=UPI001CC74C87|nr:DUF3606 domain-containing protein [Ferruginibacter albus]UAY53081.1 DUF3606 domain-containing protein [Ferruginibacter albus]